MANGVSQQPEPAVSPVRHLFRQVAKIPARNAVFSFKSRPGAQSKRERMDSPSKLPQGLVRRGDGKLVAGGRADHKYPNELMEIPLGSRCGAEHATIKRTQR